MVWARGGNEFSTPSWRPAARLLVCGVRAQGAREKEINSISGLPLVTCMTVLIQSIFNKLEVKQLLESREQATNSSNRRRASWTPHQPRATCLLRS